MCRGRQRIDFQRSDIRWVTSKEKSQGTFQIEAVLRLWSNASVAPRLFALSAPVLAGNMYVDGGLCKEPSYMFQVAVGASEHVILRTDMSAGWLASMRRLGGIGAATDTLGPNSRTFDSFDINLDMEPAKLLRSYAEIAPHYSQRDHFTGLISICLANAGRVELEFPVKHLNLLPSRTMWQLEAGPVLFLKQGCAASLTETSLADLLPYFVHSNRFDCAEFSPDFPFPRGRSPRSVNATKGKIQCDVQFLVGDK